MAASAREVIEGLREEIRRIERRPPRRRDFTSSGQPDVDALLAGGGFPRGAMSEIAGSAGSGKTALALSTLVAASGEEGIVAFVDARRELYPPAAASLGMDLDRLLIVRPPAGTTRAGEEARMALWAGEALLASGAFEAVALDIPLSTALRRRAPGASIEAMLRRVRAAAEVGGCVALWLAGEEGVRIPAAVRLELSGGTGPRVRRAFARRSADVWEVAAETSVADARGAAAIAGGPVAVSRMRGASHAA